MTSLSITVSIFKLLYKPLIRNSARQILIGRLAEPDDAQKGCWSQSDVDQMLNATWERVDELIPAAKLSALPNLGNRHNVFLAIVTTATYQVLLERVQDRTLAADLMSDIGWRIYALGTKIVSLPFRITTRDASKRLERTIRMLLIFPFSAPGRPGYEVKTWNKDGEFLTHWTWCPPQAFVRALVERDGDQGELEAFYRSWCQYDWPGADLIANDGERGHYTRTHTMSKGDAVCDMCWKGKAFKNLENA